MKLSGALLFCVALAAVACGFWIDAAVSSLFGAVFHIWALERIFSGAVLTAVAALFMLLLLGIGAIRGHMARVSRLLVIACGYSILAYILNRLLKIVFGRPTPLAAAHDRIADGFYWLQGDGHTSFPSGHMALAGAFAGVLLHFFPSSRVILLPLLLLLGAALIVGNWHYVSDVIAGGMLGLGIGLVGANFWGDGRAAGD